jgi:hypothetical protein
LVLVRKRWLVQGDTQADRDGVGRKEKKTQADRDGVGRKEKKTQVDRRVAGR